MTVFSGSYLASDVQFLLKPIQMQSTPLLEKEKLIQQKKKHYSEMIGQESLPSEAYLRLFYELLAQNKARLAHDLWQLALKINQRKQGQIILISLARAGTPIGVLLKRILQQYFQRDCHHYSISIIRDRGLDNNALAYLLTQHQNPESFTFIDGWTGKGIITQELRRSITQFNQTYQTTISSDLYVLNDIAGVAAVAASYEDYLIVSSLLNATISGLISRSILNHDYIFAGDFHGCVYYAEFAQHDLSLWFIEQMMTAVADFSQTSEIVMPQFSPQQVQQQSALFIAQLQTQYQISHANFIKPGIAEATRVLLRRVPNCLILKNKSAPDTAHLILLAQEKAIPILENPTMPYQATAIIAETHYD